MEITDLIEGLSKPEAYPYAVDRIEIRQTHISLVLLAGAFVYKIKKPVQLGFLDFSTLEKRHHFCVQEVILNRRLAPKVYLGVVPVTPSATGLKLEGEGTPVEWAVKMRHLPEEATLESFLARNEIDTPTIQKLAKRLAKFHAQASSNEQISAFGKFAVVAGNARENFTQTEPLRGITVHPEVFTRIRNLTEEQLTSLAPLMEDRARRGIPRDTHGDLRLDHVYFFPEKELPEDVVILDCIEFNERFRFADPISDMAFLVMDLLFEGYREQGRAFAEAYLQASGDEDGRQLVPFYTAYRAMVRGKVEGFKFKEREIPADEKQIALAKAKAHWLLALAELEQKSRRPCLLLVAGLPGTGKSTLARTLAEQGNFTLLRMDVIRKELAGVSPEVSTPTEYKAGIYTPEWTEKTYRECLRRTEALLFRGQRVLVDASFREERYRQVFLQTARRWCVPGLLVHCLAEPEVVRQRLQERTQDASDADWNIYVQAAESWEPFTPDTRMQVREINTGKTREETWQETAHLLRQAELLD